MCVLYPPCLACPTHLVQILAPGPLVSLLLSTLHAPSLVNPGAWMPQQLPPLNKFSGEGVDGVGETIDKWLEQFELVATVAHWDQPAKLANLVTRLKGPAFALFRSCPADQCSNYPLLVSELKKRFTPVHTRAVQTSLFHERKQTDKETVDTFAQDLRRLSHKAYPSSKRGGQEAEQITQTVLTNQFVAGLQSNIKAKIAGTEGTFGELLTKARFEEAKLRELRSTQAQSLTSSNHRLDTTPQHGTRHQVTNRQVPRKDQFSRQNGPRQNNQKCFNCGSGNHFANQCPHKHKSGTAETVGREMNQSHGGQVARISQTSLATAQGDQTVETVAELRQKLKAAEVREAIHGARATLHSLKPSQDTCDVKLGPMLQAQVELEGVDTTALLDTESPVTIVSLDYLMQVLVRTRKTGTTKEQWRTMTEERLQPTTVSLRNYGGDELNIVR